MHDQVDHLHGMSLANLGTDLIRTLFNSHVQSNISVLVALLEHSRVLCNQNRDVLQNAPANGCMDSWAPLHDAGWRDWGHEVAATLA